MTKTMTHQKDPDWVSNLKGKVKKELDQAIKESLERGEPELVLSERPEIKDRDKYMDEMHARKEPFAHIPFDEA